MQDIRAEGTTVRGLLANHAEQFFVPIYQRSYAWTQEDVDQLLEDLNADPSGGLFLGSIVVNVENKNRLEVIDGQQRLTTLLIMFSVIRDELFALKAPEYEKMSTVLYADQWTKDVSRLFKLQLGESNRELFRDYVLRSPSDPLRRGHAEVKALPKAEQYANFNLIENKRRIENHIAAAVSGKSSEEAIQVLDALANQIADQVQFVVIRVSNVEDAFLLFESLNDRGLQLSAADLVKSHLLSQYQKNVGGGTIKDAHDEWQEVLDDLGGADIGRFLRYYLLQSFPKVQSVRVFSFFKQKIASEGPQQVLASMRTNSRTYGELQNPSQLSPDVRAGLERILDLRATTCYVALMPARSALGDTASFARLIRLVEALAFRWTSVAGKNAQQLESLFQAAARDFVELGASALPIVEKRLTEALPSSDEFEAPFRHKRMGTQYVARYMLRRLESVVSRGNEVHGPQKVHIEHVMPQTLSTEWRKSLGSDASELHASAVHRWGNLTLLSSKLNRKLQNKSFQEKQKIYSDPSQSGTAVALTQMIGSCKSWGPKDIDARQVWMGAIANQVWGLPGINGDEIVIPDAPC